MISIILLANLEVIDRMKVLMTAGRFCAKWPSAQRYSLESAVSIAYAFREGAEKAKKGKQGLAMTKKGEPMADSQVDSSNPRVTFQGAIASLAMTRSRRSPA